MRAIGQMVNNISFDLTSFLRLFFLFCIATMAITTEVYGGDIISSDSNIPLVGHGFHHRQRRGLHMAKPAQACGEENSICSNHNAQICRNNTCVSACSIRGMKECRCDTQEDDFCYLCCGSESHRCLPAHEYKILKHNGERWERESCAICRIFGTEMDGLACDDEDNKRLCHRGKCSKSICQDKMQGEYCDQDFEKICVGDVCENPCAKIASHLRVCDCPALDPVTGFASNDRCHLCCYDFNVTPSSQRCQSAFHTYHMVSPKTQRPIWRVGLKCAIGEKRCNRYGICSNDAAAGASPNPIDEVLPPAIFFTFVLICFVFLLVVASKNLYVRDFWVWMTSSDRINPSQQSPDKMPN